MPKPKQRLERKTYSLVLVISGNVGMGNLQSLNLTNSLAKYQNEKKTYSSIHHTKAGGAE